MGEISFIAAKSLLDSRKLSDFGGEFLFGNLRRVLSYLLSRGSHLILAPQRAYESYRAFDFWAEAAPEHHVDEP